ncbi:MAG: hypothetical protein LW832_10665 [Parachlamydia sp.]|jgi:protein arginine kinase activator|nr:hypothetical protein [Parachlamydia sp.]
MDKSSDKNLPDRPLECGECKKPIAVRYTEIVGDSIIHTSMCADCPELQRRLHGTSPQEHVQNLAGLGTGLECGNCGTTLEDIKRGRHLGCADCYSVFQDVILQDLQAAGKLPVRILAAKKSAIHIGRLPGESVAINPSSRLLALNEALSETLKREDYEQAAWLRDEIRALTENQKKGPEEKEGKNGK